MLPKSQRQVRLKSRPIGIPEAQHFEIVAAPVPEPGERTFVVRNEFLSIEPAMRGWVNAAQNYSRPVAIGEVMRSYAAGEVVGLAPSRLQGGRQGDGPARLAGLCALGRGRRAPRARDRSAAVALARRARLERPHRLFRPPRPRPAAAGRHGGGLDGGGIGRLGGRPDRQDHGLPHGRHRRRRGEGAALPRAVRL